MRLSAFYKIPFGVLPVVIIFWQLKVSIGTDGFRVTDYFSLFTIISNLLAGVVLVISAFKLNEKTSQKVDYLRGMNCVYLLIVGIVYYALIEGTGGFTYLTIDHSNFILHRLMPLILLIDFSIERPKVIFKYKNTLAWLIIPLIYVTYSLIRGALINWYPYDFLNPSEIGGYKIVSIYVLAITLGFLTFGYGVYYLCNCRRKNNIS